MTFWTWALFLLGGRKEKFRSDRGHDKNFELKHTVFLTSHYLFTPTEHA